jgi:hypothetical protein
MSVELMNGLTSVVKLTTFIQLLPNLQNHATRGTPPYLVIGVGGETIIYQFIGIPSSGF